MSDFLSRYQEGRCEEVWEEIAILGEAIFQPPYLDDVTLVAREIVQRAVYNIHMLIERLPKLGYKFGYTHLEKTPLEQQQLLRVIEEDREFFARLYPEDPHLLMNQVARDTLGFEEWTSKKPTLWKSPSENVQQLITLFEGSFGTLPLILKTWYESVGEVNLYGVPPSSWIDPPRTPIDKDTHDLDPLYVVSLTHILEQQRYDPKDDGYNIYLAPHELFKGDQHDRGGYAIHVPSTQADALLLEEWHHTTFVGYLRACFQWGGLPGLEGWSIPQEELDFLTRDLVKL